MSKIYIVVSSYGEYEDFHTTNEKAFVNRKDAEDYAKKLDEERYKRPSFITDNFVSAYDKAILEMTDLDEFPTLEDADKAFIELLYNKGFMVTEKMLNDYEEWLSSQSDAYGGSIIEELELI